MVPAGGKDSIANRYMTILWKQTVELYAMNRMSLRFGRKTIQISIWGCSSADARISEKAVVPQFGQVKNNERAEM